nr:DNA-directed DNA polymerase [Tanacetum cinerariifolium]
MLVEVGKFTFPADFVILEMEEDSKTKEAKSSIPSKEPSSKKNSEFDKFMAMITVENSKSETDTEKPPFEKITIDIDYKSKTSHEEPHTDLELQTLPNNLEYVFLEEPSLVLEKCHFMVKEGIILGHKVSGVGVEVDKAKINVISKLPPLLILKLLEKDTPFEFDDKCQKAFELLNEKLTCAPVIVSPYWNLPFELMCDASDFAVGVVLGNLHALWAFRTTYKTPIGITPYKLIYGKNCHLPLKIEHRAYWALMNCNPDIIAAGSRNGWMRYEDGGKSLENMVESGDSNVGLKGCLDPWYLRLFALRRKREVALGPKRQQVAAAGSPKITEDAPIVDEGALTILAPVHTPQPAAGLARTMVQRIGRLKEDVHGIRGNQAWQIPEIGFCMFFLYFAQDIAGKEVDEVGVVSIIWNPMPSLKRTTPMVTWHPRPPSELVIREHSPDGVALVWVLDMLPLPCSASKVEAVVVALLNLSYISLVMVSYATLDEILD